MHNLLSDPPFSKLQLISCRNLMIYLDREIQRKILQLFHFALTPGGYLFLGCSESADICSELFVAVDKKNRVYRAQALVARPQAPLMKTEPGLVAPALTLDAPVPPSNTALAALHQRVLEQHAPPSVIIDPQGQVVHLSGRAGQFLHYNGGEPSHSLLALVHPDLRGALRAALSQAKRSGCRAEARQVQLRRNEGAILIDILVSPFRDGHSQSDLLLVLFAEAEGSAQTDPRENGDTRQGQMIMQLEAELQHTQQQLLETIEQAQISTQELKASNEELQAVNEELRSITEEVETSKEELQSINEELLTVNHELKYKVDESDRLNDDLQNLITATDIATVFLDDQLHIKWYTPRASEIFNIIPSDAGRSLLDITHRLLYDRLARDTRSAIESAQLMEREVASVSGQWYIARLVPYGSHEGGTAGIGLTFINITRRRQAEAKLQAGQEHMRMVAQSTLDYAILTLDHEACITSWNRGAELLFGYSEAEALGQSSALLFLPEERERNAHLEEIRMAREEGRAEDERWHQRQDGTRVYCSGVVTPLLAAPTPGASAVEGPPTGPPLPQGYAKIARDLTRRKRKEQAQQTRLERTRAANQQKDEFFAVMSHELKHPLNLIQLNAELLSRLPAIKEVPLANRAASSIVASVRTQARVIDDLLDLSRMRTGKLQLERVAVDMNELLQGFIESLEVQAHARGLTTALLLPPAEEAPVVVDGDPIRIEQILWNLLSNALKFTPAGGKIVLALGKDAQQGMARLEISDNGQGITPASLPIIFDMFGQGGGRHAPRLQEGLGIGLALVRQLTEAQGGEVEVESAGLGQGSLFRVRLPLHVHPVVEAAPTADSPPGKLLNLRVLLVDDSPELLEVLRMLLEMEQAQVTSVSSGTEALQAAADGTFDLIVSDLGMPEMDGHQLIAQLRKLPTLAQVPAIALTGYGAAQDVQKALDAGFNRHLNKPVTLDALIEAIEQLELGARPPPS